MPAPRTPGRTAPRATARATAASTSSAQLQRQQLLAQQILASRPDVTPEAALRLAAAALTRNTGARPTSARRPTAARPKAKPAKTRTSRPSADERTGRRWTTRLSVVAMSTLLVPAAAVIALPGAETGSGAPGSVDVTELALSAQSTLLAKADRYRQLEQQVAERHAELQAAHAAVATVQAQVVAQQQQLGTVADALYRSTPEQRHPLLGLNVHDAAATAAALQAQAAVELADQDRTSTAVRTARTVLALQDARDQVTAAEAAVARAQAEAADVLRLVRDKVEGLGPEVTGRIAGLAAIPAAGPQQERNQAATLRWQDYLARLAGAGIESPAAAALADPAHLPPGLSPALDQAGNPIPGVAWAVIGSSPVTVLPAETVAAVSTALSQLGKPYVPASRGPETYDCGGFTSAAWLLAGQALPATPQEQWAAGAPVAPDALQVGDLVFAPDGLDVGLYLGEGDVIAASAGTYQVGVRDVLAGSPGVRPTLAPPAQPNPALTGVSPTGACGAPLPSAARAGVSAAWGGWSNGRIPAEALCELGVHRHALRCDAAMSYRELATAYEAAFGTPLCITDSYRSLGAQVAAFYAKPALAAVPGTSNHGWALAVDLCGGVNVAGTPQWTWMTQNAARFGFVQPEWACPDGGEKPEPWHWEYGYLS